MGLFSTTMSFCQFQVEGHLPAHDVVDWAGQRLAEKMFQSIDQTGAPISTGWVHIDDGWESNFSHAAAYRRDHYLAFTLRRDLRKVPKALLKEYLARAERSFLQAHPGLRRVPRYERDELRDRVEQALLAKILPTPSFFDVVWNLESGLVTFTSCSGKIMEIFRELFKDTFEGLRVVLFHPYARARKLVSAGLASELERTNQASSNTVISLVSENQWIGHELMRWLIYRTMVESSRYVVTRPGPSSQGVPFIAYLSNRFKLRVGTDSGDQKLAISGPQDHYREVCAALRDGKEITEARLYLEADEQAWKMVVKGDVFHFGSFSCPPVRLGKDDITEEGNAQEAVFYARMHALETGLQLFDSLFGAFLEARLGPGWTTTQADMGRWLASA